MPRLKLSFKTHSFKGPSSSPPPHAARGRSRLESLPQPVIFEIGRHSEWLGDVLNLSLCSHKLRSLLIPYLYSNVRLKTNKQCKASLVSLAKSPELAQHIRRLAVCPNRLEWTAPGEEIDEGLVSDLIARITPSLRSLEYFVWDGWEMPLDVLWTALRKGCPLLKGISTTIGDQPLNPGSPLYAFSNLEQFSITVKTRSLEWLANGPPKVERLPRRLWEMLIERCPRLEQLSLVAAAPAHRLFDVRNVTLGRWPRLRSITLGDMILQSDSKDDSSSVHDYQAFMKFFTAHPRLRHVAFQHAGGSATFPSVFALPFAALPHLTSFHGPLKYLRSLPHPEKLVHLTLTSLHHTFSSFNPTFTALQDFPNLESLSIWIDLSFGGRMYESDDGRIFRTFLTACPTLRHLEMMCFTRPTFRMKDFSRALQLAPNLESFTLTKMYKASDEEMLASATRIVHDNPNIKSFTLRYTQDRWPTLSPGRLKQMGVYRTIYREDEGMPPVHSNLTRETVNTSSSSSSSSCSPLVSKDGWVDLTEEAETLSNSHESGTGSSNSENGPILAFSPLPDTTIRQREPIALQACEWKTKSFGTENARRFVYQLEGDTPGSGSPFKGRRRSSWASSTMSPLSGSPTSSRSFRSSFDLARSPRSSISSSDAISFKSWRRRSGSQSSFGLA